MWGGGVLDHAAWSSKVESGFIFHAIKTTETQMPLKFFIGFQSVTVCRRKPLLSG